MAEPRLVTDVMSSYYSRDPLALQQRLRLHIQRCETLADVLANRLGVSPEARETLRQAIDDYLAGRPVLPEGDPSQPES